MNRSIPGFTEENIQSATLPVLSFFYLTVICGFRFVAEACFGGQVQKNVWVSTQDPMKPLGGEQYIVNPYTTKINTSRIMLAFEDIIKQGWRLDTVSHWEDGWCCRLDKGNLMVISSRSRSANQAILKAVLLAKLADQK